MAMESASQLAAVTVSQATLGAHAKTSAQIFAAAKGSAQLGDACASQVLWVPLAR